MLQRLPKLRHLQVYEGQFVIEDLAGIHVYQLYVIAVPIRFLFSLIKYKVENSDEINRLQFVIPFVHLGLFPNGEGSVVKRPVLKEALFGFL